MTAPTTNPLVNLAFQQSYATRVESALCLLDAFRRFGIPGTMLDVGCGAGHLVEIAHALYVHAIGMDIAIEHETSRLWRADITQPLKRGLVAFDLVLCLEVAEHLPAADAGGLCSLLAATTRGRLLFSAATPGQGGAGHVNEQPFDYWVERLTACGLRLDERATTTLRESWSRLAPAAWWYGNNVSVWVRP